MVKLVLDPEVAEKIAKMQQRVRWQDPLILERNIDQTCLVLADKSDHLDFSFLVAGDSGSGKHLQHNPQGQVAQLMSPHLSECSFMLHTGDVIYLVGSSEYYQQNFIRPYQEWIVGGEHPQDILYDQMVFKFPILPVPGNHDYYDLPVLSSLISLTTMPFRHLWRSRLQLDVGLHGSRVGDAYSRAFLDYLQAIPLSAELIEHLDKYYTAKHQTERCLFYQPGSFTRLPNRYYTFNYRGIDFFALDSNTFNNPQPLAKTPEGAKKRETLAKSREDLENQKMQILEAATQLNPDHPVEADQLDDLHNNLSQMEEIILDIDKQLDSDQSSLTDIAQLEWLKEKLIKSWHNPLVRGRVIYFHHPPYVTEITKWQQGQTLVIRKRIRDVLDAVVENLGSLTGGRPLVDLVLNGHAHCLEHLETGETGHGDAHIQWLICGGSGFSLRRQRPEGADLWETVGERERLVARSHRFVGRNGQGTQKRRPYSSLRIDVTGDRLPQFIIRPLVAEWYQQKWHNYGLKPFILNGRQR